MNLNFNLLLLLLILFLVIANFLLFNKNYIIALINLLIIIIYILFLRKDLKYKKILILTILHFSFWGPLIESLLIKKTNLLVYKKPDLKLNIPLWLPSAYSLFAIVTLHTFDIIKDIF